MEERDYIDEYFEILIAKGLLRDVGRNDKDEIIYDLTDEGKKYADVLLGRIQKK